jgi:hypothetical protein
MLSLSRLLLLRINERRIHTQRRIVGRRLINDPNPYFEHLRSKSPVTPLPHHSVVAVTEYEEAIKIYNDTETFSSVNAVTGRFPPVPFAIDSDDIGEHIEAWRTSCQ